MVMNSASNLLWIPPNSVPGARFSFPMDTHDRGFTILGCRHGFLLLLLSSQGGLRLLVWDPVNGHEHPLVIPPGFGVKNLIHGAVLRSALGDINHFQVVLVSTDEQRVTACVYSSETGVWGNLISTTLSPNVSPAPVDPTKPVVLVGDSLYMLLVGNSSSIVEFDVDRQSLAVVRLPMCLNWESSRYYSVMRAEGGGLGIIFVSRSDSDRSVQLWKRTTDCDGIASWVLARTVELDKQLPVSSRNLRAFAEENNVLFLWTYHGVFMVQLDSLQFKELPEINLPCCHPFEAVYGAGI